VSQRWIILSLQVVVVVVKIVVAVVELEVLEQALL
jgi:hypothetical protein